MYTEMEKWLQTAQVDDVTCYYRGYLAKDRFYNNEVKKVANLMLRSAYSKLVILYQKRMEYGTAIHDPVFKYMAKKI